MPGRENHHLVSGIAGHWQRGSMSGRLYPEGIGKSAGYPVLVCDDSANLIGGWVLESDELSAHWLRLDEFEGDAYRRIVSDVLLENGSWGKAFVYVLAEQEEDALNGR